MKLWIRLATPLTIVMSFAITARAQFNAGIGLWGGTQACPYGASIGSGAVSEDDTVNEIKKQIEDIKKSQKEKQRELDHLKRTDMKASLKAINGVLNSDFADFAVTHIDNNSWCDLYKGIGVENKDDKQPAAAGTDNGYPVKNSDYDAQAGYVKGSAETTPFHQEDWKRYCDPGKPGSVSGALCADSRFRVEDKGAYNVHDCAQGLIDYRKQKRQSERLERELANLKKDYQAAMDQLKGAREDAAEARRQAMQDRLEGGICETCAMRGNGYTYQRPDTDWASVIGNVALGGLMTYAGASANRAVINANADNGWPVQQQYPAVGYGMPFFATALQQSLGGGGGVYGAIGGSVGAGGFGCAGGALNPWGNVWGNPYAMMNPLASMGGGLFMPGMGPWGMNGMMNGMMNPMMNMMMNPMAGMMNPMMGMNGMMNPMAMMMNPMLGMNGMLNPMANMSMNPMMNMMNPMANMMMNPMLGMNGMNPMLGMNGMMNPMMGMNGAGSLGMMQMQQQMMQMQMQQYQYYMQQQQSYMQQAMQRQQVASSIQSEIYSLVQRLQMIQYGGIGATGYLGGNVGLGASIGINGGFNTGYAPGGVPIGGLTSSGTIGVGGGVVGPSPIPIGGGTAVTPLGTGR